jgi:hypothetical protein
VERYPRRCGKCARGIDLHNREVSTGTVYSSIMGRGCSWPRGCSQEVGSHEKHCAYHAKVASGLVTSTRGSGTNVVAIIPAEPKAKRRPKP